MASPVVTDPSLQALVYVAIFSLATVACFLSLRRARLLDDEDTRKGLTWLLVTSGGWATAHVGYLLFPTVEIATGFHIIGLIFGIATIGPWLYFCSAYTGRQLHRDPRFQHLAVAVFGLIVLIKITNPIHGLYFSTQLSGTPFAHVAIQYGVLHWLASGLAYALAAVGYFMILELFVKADQRTRWLTALVTVTAVPLLLNIVADATDVLVNVGYEPLGVAVFAVGVVYLFTDRFEVVRMTGDVEAPVIYLDAEGLVRDYNATAAELFPAVEDAIGEALEAELPAVADLLDREEPILELDDEGRQYYRLLTNQFTLGRSAIGEVLVLSDVTESERHRRELERQNERLERFASVVSHDLRNPLNVAKGRIDVARTENDNEHLEAAASAIERMETLIEDVLALARHGESIGETETVSLSAMVERTRDAIDLQGATLTVEEDCQFVADEDRARQLLENLLRNAIDHGGSDVTIRVGATAEDHGFFVADDGPGIPPEEREEVFETGYTTADEGTGFGLAIVSEIAEAHGWDLAVTESEDGGARFEITGVEQRWGD